MTFGQLLDAAYAARAVGLWIDQPAICTKDELEEQLKGLVLCTGLVGKPCGKALRVDHRIKGISHGMCVPCAAAWEASMAHECTADGKEEAP